MILDTSILVDVLRGDFDKEKLERLEDETVLKTTSVTEMELWEGVLESKSKDEEKRKVKELLKEIESEKFTPEDGRTAGRINHDLRKSGNQVDLEDVMIASIATKRDEKVLTRNEKHFEKIEELEVVNTN
jgi:predicted nucleic acid-binding protein